MRPSVRGDDARTNLSARTQGAKTAAVFADFVHIYSLSPQERTHIAESHPRFECFTREQIRNNDDRLDLTIISGKSGDGREFMPDDSVKAVNNLRMALKEALALADQMESLLAKDENANE